MLLYHEDEVRRFEAKDVWLHIQQDNYLVSVAALMTTSAHCRLPPVLIRDCIYLNGPCQAEELVSKELILSLYVIGSFCAKVYCSWTRFVLHTLWSTWWIPSLR